MDARHACVETYRADTVHIESHCSSTATYSRTMKANLFLSFISVMLAALLGHLAFNVANGKENDVICGIGSCICFAATLIPAMGLQYDSGRLSVNIRVFSSIFFVLFAISHFCFAGFGVKMPFYFIVNGIMLMIYLAIFYKIQGVKNT